MKCGVGDYSYNLAKFLSMEDQTDVFIITSAHDYQINNLNKVHIFSMMKKWGLGEIFKFISALKLIAPDIIHIQYPTQGYGKGFLPWLIPLISFMANIKVVQTWHEGYSIKSSILLAIKALVPGWIVFVRENYFESFLNPKLTWMVKKVRRCYIKNASVIPRAVISESSKVALKKQHLGKQKRLIVFFGFIHPDKRIELLFEIANPEVDQIVIIGDIDSKDPYHQMIFNLAKNATWQGKCNFTGFLPTDQIASLLSVADAAILPFRNGGGGWNTSIHAAISNRIFTLTTSSSKNGYDENTNVYYAYRNDIAEMKKAFNSYVGIKNTSKKDFYANEWAYISKKHLDLYKKILNKT